MRDDDQKKLMKVNTLKDFIFSFLIAALKNFNSEDVKKTFRNDALKIN